MPPERIELSTPGLQDQCSATELKRLSYMGIKHLGFQCTCFGSTYTKIGTIQRRLAWPLRKDDTQNREAFHIFRTASLQQYIGANQNFSLLTLCAAGVVVSCKIPILATRVRFPGGAKTYIAFFKHKHCNYSIIELNTVSNRGDVAQW